ncbi:MAG: putative toxin-antitoxin system toxin component, PIN family [Burkholderiales bacterium]
MRLVLDTNTVLSGLLWQNNPGKLLDLALVGRIELFTSQMLLLELADVLPRAQFAKKIAASSFSVEGLITRYAVLAQSVEPAIISPTSVDPDDDHVLACALAAKADLIVSRDKDLLNLKRFHNIAIVNAASAIARIEAAAG